MRIQLPKGCLRLAAACGLALAALGFAAPQAAAQVQIIVNGEPITAYDIDQRIKLVTVSTRKAPSRQEVIEELIEEKLKLSVSKFYKVDIAESEIEGSFASIGQRMRQSPQQFAQSLTQAGIHVPSFKQKLKADIGWQAIIRGKFSGDFQFREQDIIAAAKGDDKDKVGYEYVLRPVLFFLPRGASQAAIDGRRREAEALRGRFQSCDESLAFTRALSEVAVRDQIVRNSADLPPQLREVMNNVSVGKLTPPEVTPNGIEMFAVCAKRENTADTPSKRAAREELLSEKFNAQAKRYLKELRAKAMIEYR